MGKINGFVYRDGQELFLVSMITEKKHKISEDIYNHLDNKSRIKEETIVLCWYDERAYNMFETSPVIIVDLTYNNDKIKANQIKFDDLITCAFNAAIIYVKKKKVKSD